MFSTSIPGVNSGENHNFLGKLHGNTLEFLVVEVLSSTSLGHKWKDQQVASWEVSHLMSRDASRFLSLSSFSCHPYPTNAILLERDTSLQRGF